MPPNPNQPKAIDYPFEVNELLKFKKIFCPCSTALLFWDRYKDQIRSSGETSFFCFYKTLSDIVMTWCGLLFAIEPNFSTPSLFIVDDPQYWFQTINKLNPKIAENIFFLSSREKIGPERPHPCYSVLVITNFEQYVSYVNNLQYDILILFVHIDEEEVYRPLSLYHSSVFLSHENADWEDMVDATNPLYIIPTKEERRIDHSIVVYKKVKTRHNEEMEESERIRLEELEATPPPLSLMLADQLEFCKFIYWKDSLKPEEEIVHANHNISLMILNIPDLELYQKAINNYLYHYDSTNYVNRTSSNLVCTKNGLKFVFPGYKIISSRPTMYYKPMTLVITPTARHIKWAYTTLSAIRKSKSFTDHTKVFYICRLLPPTIDVIDPCDTVESKVLRWAGIAFSKTMGCVFSSLEFPDPHRKVAHVISETRDICDALLTQHYASKVFRLSRPDYRSRRFVTIPSFENLPKLTKLRNELLTAKKGHTANIVLSMDPSEETTIEVPHPNPLLSKTYLVNHILVILSYLGLFITNPPRHSALTLENLFPLDRMVDPAHHKWRAHYVTFTLVAHCVILPNTKFFACPDYTSGLIYAVTPSANHVIVGSYGDDVRKIIRYILPNLLEGSKYFHFTYVPTDISKIIISTATSLGYLHEVKPVKNNPIFSLTEYYCEIYFFKKKCQTPPLSLATSLLPPFLENPNTEEPLFSLE